MSGLYVYALLGGGTDGPAEAGLRGEPVRWLDWSGLRVAAGELEAAPAPTREALRAHDAVVRRLAARFPAVLPARFGQWAADPAELAAEVAARRAELAAALTLVEGCAQMTLRLFVALPAEAPAEESEATTGPGARYLAGRRLPAGVRELRRALAPLLRAERLERHGERPLLATAYDLVERAAAERYRQLVGERAAAACGWRAVVSGPLPPYAFAPGLRS